MFHENEKYAYEREYALVKRYHQHILDLKYIFTFQLKLITIFY